MIDANAWQEVTRSSWVERLRNNLEDFEVEKMRRHARGATVTSSKWPRVVFDLVYRNPFDVVTHVILLPEREHDPVVFHLKDLTKIQAAAYHIEHTARRCLEGAYEEAEKRRRRGEI